MAILEISVTNDEPSQVFEVQLDGATYRILMRWNEREGAWYMSISDVGDVVIASGIKVVANWPLLRMVRDPRRPPGALIALDTSSGGVQPGYSDIGKRVKLQYFDAAELETIGG